MLFTLALPLSNLNEQLIRSASKGKGKAEENTTPDTNEVFLEDDRHISKEWDEEEMAIAMKKSMYVFFALHTHQEKQKKKNFINQI